VPLSGLLDPAFAATRRCLIHDQALVARSPWEPVPALRRLPEPERAAAGPGGGHTNHIVTAGKWPSAAGGYG
jgi:hypothetical protein